MVPCGRSAGGNARRLQRCGTQPSQSPLWAALRPSLFARSMSALGRQETVAALACSVRFQVFAATQSASLSGSNGSKAVPAGIAIPPLHSPTSAVPRLSTSFMPGCILPRPILLNRLTSLPLSTTNIALAPSSVDLRRRTTNIERCASFLPAWCSCSEPSAMVIEPRTLNDRGGLKGRPGIS